ncbi:MAG: glycoside hydrolase family 27 protein [Treponema sp.]|nr:glycoside hydrolase family 27 protein [Treponema sp.]
MALNSPSVISNPEGRFDSFANGKIFEGKKPGRLPAMGWNSWNAFGSGNTEALTRAMADCIVALGLDKLGYKYVVLDDGCYKSERVNGRLSNEPVKFPGGFKALSDYVHSKGLKFGMYNDIGTNLCAGAAVGTCGHEDVDAASYVEWGVDFLKIDNCYYLWDNATFSNPENARFVFAPRIRGISLDGLEKSVCDAKITGTTAHFCKEGFVEGIGTFDGTNTGTTPVGLRSSELVYDIVIQDSFEGEYELCVEYASSRENGIGEWLQIAVQNEEKEPHYYFDKLLPPSENKETFIWSVPVKIRLEEGHNYIRLMNHRRQENTLDSYAAMLSGLNKAKPGHEVVLSMCEWGKTHPQNWAYKVGDSWRILNDITFRVGSDGNPGFGAWFDKGTPSVTSQYNKAVVMDEFAGLDKGWNDPDMLMIGMDGLSMVQNKTHFTMWCMMNSPLMLGLDLRRVSEGDELYKIIANHELIALNQDALGVQAKRILTTGDCGGLAPDKAYIEDIDRVDVLAKPLSDGGFALSFINVSEKDWEQPLSVNIEQIEKTLEKKYAADKYSVKDLWSGETWEKITGLFGIERLGACDCVVLKVKSK